MPSALGQPHKELTFDPHALATEEVAYRGTFNARGPASLPVTF